jgi:hypothetical protein
VALASAASQSGHWANAESAWQSAERHIHGAPGDRGRALATAYRGEGLTLIGAGKDAEASAALRKALDLLAPLAPESADATQVTTAEIDLADVMAWAATVGARRASEDAKAHPPDTNTDQPGLPGRPPMCHGKVAAKPQPAFPDDMLQASSVGAGVVRLQTDDTGAVINAVLLASVPGDEFRRSLMDPTVHWVFTPAANRVPGCRLASADRLVVVDFVIRGPN